MQIHNAAVTGSFTYNGIDISDITGSEQSVTSLNDFSASILNYTSSNNQSIASLNAASASLFAATASLSGATASLFNYTSSNNDSIADIRVATASLYAVTASINSYTASNNANIAALYAATASLYAATASIYNATASIYGATSSLFNFSSSATLRINALDQYTASLNTRSASFACVTATNNFTCTQYFSNTSNAVSFTSTGSLYSDGGVRITKDMYVSGTAFFNNVTVFGTQSINYISSSQLNIASNIISVNTATPTVRFGGLAVYDSGSLGTGLTGSILWDSEDNQWIYSNPSGSTYDSAVFLVGPRNSGVLGNEPGISCNFLSKGNGLHHMTSSGIFEDGSRTCFYGTSRIDSSGNACFSNTVCAPSFVGGTISGTTGTFSSNVVATGSLIVAPSSNVELQVQSTGVTIGNLVTDSHQITGSLLTSGSVLSFSPLLRVCACTLEPGNTVTSYTSLQPQGFDFNTACSSGNRGIRIYANNALALSPGGAAIQFFSSDHSNFPGQFYMDSGANNNAALIFRTAVTAGNITERMRITSAGVACFACQVCAPAFVGGTVSGTRGTFTSCLGVGHSPNGYILDVCGSQRTIGSLTINEDGAGTKVLTVRSDWAGVDPAINVTTNNCLLLMTNNTVRVCLSNTGIATFACQVCAPQLRLAGSTNIIVNPSFIGSSNLRNGGAIQYTKNFTIFTDDGATGCGFDLQYYNGSNYYPGLRLNNVSSGFASLSLMQDGGGVSIGNTSPLTKLHVNNAVAGAILPYIQGTGLSYNNEGISVAGSNTNNTNIGNGLTLYNNVASVGAYGPVIAWSSMTVNGAYNSTYAFITGIYGGAGGDNNWAIGDLILGTAGSYGATERMRIRYNGNIGIGCTTPTSPLTIRCDSSSGASFMEIATCFNNAYRYVSINAGSGIEYCIPGGTSQSPYIQVQGGDTSAGGGSFKIRTGAMGSVSDKMIITQGGVACFSSTICAPTAVISAGPLRVGPDAARATLHVNSGNDGNRAAFIHTTGTQRFSMYGKYIQSYAGAAVNVPLFVACGMANTGIMVKVNIYGTNAVSAMRYEDAGYAGIYYIGGGLQSSNASITTICNLGGVAHGIGTLYWCTSTANPLLYYCQANNGYIAESLDVHITIRDSANVYFCTEFISCG